jgi:hypothetical protein
MTTLRKRHFTQGKIVIPHILADRKKVALPADLSMMIKSDGCGG